MLESYLLYSSTAAKYPTGVLCRDVFASLTSYDIWYSFPDYSPLRQRGNYAIGLHILGRLLLARLDSIVLGVRGINWISILGSVEYIIVHGDVRL